MSTPPIPLPLPIRGWHPYYYLTPRFYLPVDLYAAWFTARYGGSKIYIGQVWCTRITWILLQHAPPTQTPTPLQLYSCSVGRRPIGRVCGGVGRGGQLYMAPPTHTVNPPKRALMTPPLLCLWQYCLNQIFNTFLSENAGAASHTAPPGPGVSLLGTILGGPCPTQAPSLPSSHPPTQNLSLPAYLYFVLCMKGGSGSVHAVPGYIYPNFLCHWCIPS